MAFANVNVSSAASNVIVAGVSGGGVRNVLGLQLVAAADVTVTLEDSDGTNLFGPVALAANGGFVLPPVSSAGGQYYAQVAAGKGINLLLSDAVQVGGSIQYSD